MQLTGQERLPEWGPSSFRPACSDCTLPGVILYEIE